jgi:hypothetical protein
MKDFIDWGRNNNKFSISPSESDKTKEYFFSKIIQDYKQNEKLISMYTPERKLIKKIPVNTIHLYKNTNNLFQTDANQELLPLDKIMFLKGEDNSPIASTKEILDWGTSKGLLPLSSTPSDSMMASSTGTKGPNS